jgi:hypothetical protein
MAILAMPDHGQDARGTKSSRAVKNRGTGNKGNNNGEHHQESDFLKPGHTSCS